LRPPGPFYNFSHLRKFRQIAPEMHPLSKSIAFKTNTLSITAASI
jgi:hypothetical protein